MDAVAQGVNLSKATDGATGPNLIEQVENLTERLFRVARELDAARAELAEAEDVEIAWIKVVMRVAAERDHWKATAFSLGRQLGETVCG
ncbi:hypothetical protein [Streptomyces variabilis]